MKEKNFVDVDIEFPGITFHGPTMTIYGRQNPCRIFTSPSVAFVHLLECTMATLSRLKDIKRNPKSEIRRHEAIIETGLLNCEAFRLKEVAQKNRCHRVVEALEAREKGSPE